MSPSDRNAIAFPWILLAGVGLALAGSDGGASIGGVPVFALLVALAFAANLLAFVPAYLARTEAFFDLTGSATYVAVAVLAVALAPEVDERSVVLLVLVTVWALRLGTFLVRRVHRAGKDGRFDELKQSFFRFLNVWALQALWVSVTVAPALAALTGRTRIPLGPPAMLGALLWLAGFSVELVADAQKSRFRANPVNRDRFIRSGLWSWSRHPNYFGEILLWTGVAIIAVPVLRGWQWVTLVSPVFVALLLTRVSGIPLLEKRSDEKWGGQPDYEAYKSRTSVLIPFPPGRKPERPR